MKIHFLPSLPLLAALAFLAFPIDTQAASCPYCGQAYGEGGRRDQAYIQRIRAEHEASCPARFRNNTPQNNNNVQPPQDDQAAAAAAEAERQAAEVARQAAEVERQRVLAEQRRKEQEEAARRQAEFDKAKRDALSSMKGIAENELGLKGLSTTDELGLKGVGETKSSELGLKGIGDPTPQPFVDSSVVDLRDLVDPNKPIMIDPNVARGRERAVPAQLDPATFKNTNYNSGFAALMRFDPEAAVPFFEQARRERPDDPLVRNGLLLAQDLVKVHRQKEQDTRTRAAHWQMQTYAALMSGEPGSALAAITRARDLAPDDKSIRALASLTQKIARGTSPANAPEQQAAYRLVGNGIASVAKDDLTMAVNYLEVAHRLSPDDACIASLLEMTRNAEAGRKDAAGKK